MFDQLESVEEERRQEVTMDERGGELMLVSPRPLDRIGLDGLPAIVTQAGEQARWRSLEFFTSNIRNKNSRMAYVQAIGSFLARCKQRGIGDLRAITPMVVAAYIGQHPGVPPTVKQHLAAIRMLFDWLVTAQIVPMNPASPVRGPKYVVKRGKTPMLSAEEARTLLASIDIRTIAGLRDRALIGVMVHTLARVRAVIGMRVQDYYPKGKRWWFRLHEKAENFSRCRRTIRQRPTWMPISTRRVLRKTRSHCCFAPSIAGGS